MSRVTEEQLAWLQSFRDEADVEPPWTFDGIEAEASIEVLDLALELAATVREQAAEIERLRATVERVRGLVRQYHDDDLRFSHVHGDGCDMPDCGACWTDRIIAALDGAE